jgi:hypothetical protein
MFTGLAYPLVNFTVKVLKIGDRRVLEFQHALKSTGYIVLEVLAVSISRVEELSCSEDGGSVFFKTVIPPYQATWHHIP